MIIITTNNIEGHPIQQYCGIVSAQAINGTNVVRDLLASVRDFFGGRSGSYEDVLREAKETALREVAQQAQAAGGNAIVGLRLDCEVVGQSAMMMVVASGTAVRI